MQANGVTKPLMALLLAAGLSLFARSSAHALFIEVGELSDGTLYLLATGDIEPGDDDLIKTAFKSVPEMPFIALNSRGGSLDAGHKLGLAIRSLGINTIVVPGGECYSACLAAFIGGKERAVPDGAKLGSHQFYTGGADIPNEMALSLSQSIFARLLRYFIDMGVSPEALTHIMETKPSEMFVFTEESLRDMRLVTHGSPLRKSVERKVLLDRCTGKIVDAANPPQECTPENEWRHITVPNFLKAHPQYTEGSDLYESLDREVRLLQARSIDPFDPSILKRAHEKISKHRRNGE